MSKRRERMEVRAFRTQLLIVAIMVALAAAGIVWFAPARHEQALITIYMRPDCDSCRRWMRHLDGGGFRTRLGEDQEWIDLQKRVKIPPGFHAGHYAVVQDLIISGYVPARDIHRALRSSGRDRIRALVLPGAPRGAPGVEAALKEPYVVFAMDANGLLRPWATHNHSH